MWNSVRAFFKAQPTGGAAVLTPVRTSDVAPVTPVQRHATTVAEHAMQTGSAADRARAKLQASVAQLHHVLPNPHEDVGQLIELLAVGPTDELQQIPAAAQALLRAVQDPDLPRNRLAALIEADPVIAQAMLRTVNSAVFSTGRGTVASLSHAIDRLGVGVTHAVITQQTISGMISRPGGDLDRMATMVWDHMGRVGSIARSIWPAFGVDADEAFSAGLLHDSGKLALFDAVSRLRVRHRRMISLDTESVRTMLKALHEPLGALLVHAWGMPSHVVDAIGTHHDPVKDGQPHPLAELLYVAERIDLAHLQDGPTPTEQWWEQGRLTGDRAALDAMLD